MGGPQGAPPADRRTREDVAVDAAAEQVLRAQKSWAVSKDLIVAAPRRFFFCFGDLPHRSRCFFFFFPATTGFERCRAREEGVEGAGVRGEKSGFKLLPSPSDLINVFY